MKIAYHITCLIFRLPVPCIYSILHTLHNWPFPYNLRIDIKLLVSMGLLFSAEPAQYLNIKSCHEHKPYFDGKRLCRFRRCCMSASKSPQIVMPKFSSKNFRSMQVMRRTRFPFRSLCPPPDMYHNQSS